jgi:hypothetical protein
MARIVYLLLSSGGVAGGQKMALRHVETLNDLGFEAVCALGPDSTPPKWFEHRAPMEPSEAIRSDDVVVVPEDAPEALEKAARIGLHVVVLSQGGNLLATQGLPMLQRHPGCFDRFLVISPGLRRLVGRLFPGARVEMARCFADERVFRPLEKRPLVSVVPRKRPFESGAIRNFFRHLYPQHADYRWTIIDSVPEAVVAKAMGESEIHLALPRMESVGITTLEAMASGCVCAGFVGVGGAEYATADNGFWAAEDDCLGAADALARAHDFVKQGGRPLARMREAGMEAARAWSYALFRRELEAAWTAFAPECRPAARR